MGTRMTETVTISLKDKLSGRFIVLDGPDGCGKSTQVRRLCQALESQGVDVVTFRDPGDTQIGEQIRKILLNPEHARMSNMTELLLYMASRAQLWSEKIRPALEGGRCVALDRWLSSTCAYQGHAGGFGMDRVIAVAEQTLERVWPDLTVILDVDGETAAGRMQRELDRMEQKGGDYHRKVREGFLELARGRKDFAVVDAGRDIEAVHQEVVKAVSAWAKADPKRMV
jgi:dTMP kinase